MKTYIASNTYGRCSSQTKHAFGKSTLAVCDQIKCPINVSENFCVEHLSTIGYHFVLKQYVANRRSAVCDPVPSDAHDPTGSCDCTTVPTAQYQYQYSTHCPTSTHYPLLVTDNFFNFLISCAQHQLEVARSKSAQRASCSFFAPTFATGVLAGG